MSNAQHAIEKSQQREWLKPCSEEAKGCLINSSNIVQDAADPITSSLYAQQLAVLCPCLSNYEKPKTRLR